MISRDWIITSLPTLIDFVSWDNYPTWHKEAEAVTAADTAYAA